MNNTTFKEVVEFIFSEHCNVRTKPGTAIIDASGLEPVLEWGRVPLSQTPGGKSLIRILENGLFTPSQADLALKAARTKYLTEASGDIKVLVSDDRISNGFRTSYFRLLTSNTSVSSLNAIPIEKFERLSAQDGSPRKEISASVAAVVLAGKLPVSALQKPHLLIEQGTKDRQEELVNKAVAKTIGPSLTFANQRVASAQAQVQVAWRAWRALRAEHQSLGRFKNGWLFIIPKVIPAIRLWAELRRANRERAAAIFERNILEKRVLKVPVIHDIMARVHRDCSEPGLMSDIKTKEVSRAIRDAILEKRQQAVTNTLDRRAGPPSRWIRKIGI